VRYVEWIFSFSTRWKIDSEGGGGVLLGVDGAIVHLKA